MVSENSTHCTTISIYKAVVECHTSETSEELHTVEGLDGIAGGIFIGLDICCPVLFKEIVKESSGIVVERYRAANRALLPYFVVNGSRMWNERNSTRNGPN